MFRFGVAAILFYVSPLIAESAGPAAVRVHWRFANDRVATVVVGGERPGIYWGDSPNPAAHPVVPGKVREVSRGKIKASATPSDLVAREALTFSSRRAMLAVVDERIVVLDQNLRVGRLEHLRPLKMGADGNLHLTRAYNDDPLDRELIVLELEWCEPVHVGAQRFWGEVHLVRDDGVTVRFGLLEGSVRSTDPKVTVRDRILEMKGVARPLDLEALEQEATVQTGFVARASDASQSFSGWERASELFKPLDPAATPPRLDEESEDVLTRALASLTRGRRSVVLRGKAGVGKRTLAREIAARLPRTWATFALTPDAVDSASGHAGNFSARLLTIKAASETRPVVWVLPNVHAFRGLGTHSKRDTDFFDGLLAELQSGAVRILGTADDEQHAALVRGRGDLALAFDVVNVADAGDLRLAQIAGERMRRRWIRVDGDDYRQLRAWGERFAPRTGEPGRTIELFQFALDRAAARDATKVDLEDLREAVRQRYDVPAMRLDHELALRELARLEETLARRLPGNVGAREALLGAARAALFELRPVDRPVATGLLVGPRGAGKTSLIELFGRSLELPILPLAMSTYATDYSVREFQRAVGEFAQSHPVGLVFLDELEKSAPKVQDALLKALESGSLHFNGAQGLESAPMTNLIVLGATNAGEDVVSQAARNGGRVSEAALRPAVVGALSPYLIDRFNFVEPVYPADDEAYRAVVRAQVDLALAHLGIRSEQITNFSDMIRILARERTALGSNREAERAVYRGLNEAVGEMLARRQVQTRADLSGLRYRFGNRLELECGALLSGTVQSDNVVAFGRKPRAG